MEGRDAGSLQDKAKRYSAIKYSLAIIDTGYSLVLLWLFLGLGVSEALGQGISRLPLLGRHLQICAYLLIIYLAYFILSFPLNFYRFFILEHQFSLSRQKLGDWFFDQIKAGAIFYIISLIIIEAFYYILGCFPSYWWLWVSLFWIFFSLILARLTPVVVIPLFFKYKKLSDDTLRQRILCLARKMQIKILDVFEIDFSKKTLKANAAFLGWGATRRVILADTLKERYSHEEVEVILAHEFAHYRLKHLLKLILVNSLATLIIFYLIFKTSSFTLGIFGLSQLSDIAALPLIFIYFILFGIIVQPGQNYISRRLERNADLMAIKVTNSKEAFVSMMEKLGSQNLADRNPHPLIKFLFFDHPPIDERIRLAKIQQK
jgi:STE24 endopeptidase